MYRRRCDGQRRQPANVSDSKKRKLQPEVDLSPVNTTKRLRRAVKSPCDEEPHLISDSDCESSSIVDVNTTGSAITNRVSQDDDNTAHRLIIEKPAYMNFGFTSTTLPYDQLVLQKYFVDKSKFITAVLQLGEWILAFFRHRNSMKTTHLRALESYCDFSKDRNQPDFTTLDVGTDKFYEQFCALFISFDWLNEKLVTGDSSTACTMMKKSIIFYLKNYLHNHSVSTEDIDNFIRTLDNSTDIDFMLDVCVYLKNRFHKKVLILIDNVDVPFLLFGDEYAKNAFKTLFVPFFSSYSVHVFKVIMMGNIVPTCFLKSSSLGSYIRVDIGYESRSLDQRNFLFTKGEVEKLCKKYDYPDEAVMELNRCYGGYYNSGGDLCNSFSIIQFMENNYSLTNETKPEILWHYFHSWDCLHTNETIISKAEVYIWKRILNFPTATIEFTINRMISYERFHSDLSIGFTYLLFCGYLTIVENKNPTKIVKIPNEEVRTIFFERKKKFMADETFDCEYENWNNVFNNSDDYNDFCNLLNQRLATCSSRTFSKELAYHVFLLVVFGCNKIFTYDDEPETGLGIADIVLKPRVFLARNPIVIEIGYVDSSGKNETSVKNMFNTKLRQVRSRQYDINILRDYNSMDILILIGCQRKLYAKCYKNQVVPH